MKLAKAQLTIIQRIFKTLNNNQSSKEDKRHFPGEWFQLTVNSLYGCHDWWTITAEFLYPAVPANHNPQAEGELPHPSSTLPQKPVLWLIAL